MLLAAFTPSRPLRIGLKLGVARNQSARWSVMVLRLACLASVAAVAISAGSAAYAQQTPSAPPAPAPASTAPEDEDIILQADSIEEDQDTGVVTASGNVEIRIGDRAMLADRVVYDRNNETMRAQGNVQISDGTGQVQMLGSHTRG